MSIGLVVLQRESFEIDFEVPRVRAAFIDDVVGSVFRTARAAVEQPCAKRVGDNLCLRPAMLESFQRVKFLSRGGCFVALAVATPYSSKLNVTLLLPVVAVSENRPVANRSFVLKQIHGLVDLVSLLEQVTTDGCVTLNPSVRCKCTTSMSAINPLHET